MTLKIEWTSVLSALLFSLAAIVWAVGPAFASPFTPYSSHLGEDHSREDHRGETLTGIDLTGSDISRSDFRDADLTSAVLDSADASRADFRNAVLVNASLRATVLDRANLRDANLDGASLVGALLGRASLRDANLSNANLVGANLLDVRDFGATRFDGAYYDATTLLPFGLDTSGMTLVPEPSSALLLVLGLLGLELYGRRGAGEVATPDPARAAP